MSEQASEEQKDPQQQQAGAAEMAGSGAPESASTAATSTAATPSDVATVDSSTADGAPAAGQPSEATSAAGQSATGQSAAAAASSAAEGSTAPEASAASGAGPAESSSPSTTKSVSARSHKSVTGATSARSSATGAATSARSATSRTGAEAQASDKKSSPSAAGTSTRSSRRKRMKLGELDLSTAKIGFLGAGKMAESTINGLIHYAKISPSRIHVAAPSSKGLERFKALGCRVTKRNYDIFGRYDCDIIFLCFHGYVIKHCYKLGGARPHPLTTNYIPHQRHPIYILSLVSGVSLAQIKACLLNPESSNRYVLEIHRIMMNTAVGHGLGICAIDCEPDSKKLSAPLRQLLSSIAQLENVPASQMDAACAIGGSGLAFSYYFINALADGAFKMGLSRQQAIRFASKTAQCAAQTMLESGKHPAELRDNVSSPSGAAIYGIHVLEKNDVASGVTAAVEAAHKRANDLATQEVG